MKSENPYKPPESDVSHNESLADVHMFTKEYANFGERLGAYMMDHIFVKLFLMMPTMFIEYDFDYKVGDDFSFNVAYLIVSLIYVSILDSSSKQATWGKQMMKIKVTDLNGERISMLRAASRDLGKILSAIILLVGFFMMTWTKKKQTLHDLIAGCLVVKK